MRHFVIQVLIIAACLTQTARADRMEVSLSTGYNPTAYTSEVNRSTALMFNRTFGQTYFQGSFETNGTSSIGLGYITTRSDHERETQHYPSLVFYFGPEHRSAMELKFHTEWYLRLLPQPKPDKFVTLFNTEASAIWKAGEYAKIRVSHRFVSSSRRNPSRMQGAEWVWEYRPDFPVDRSGNSSQQMAGQISSQSRTTPRVRHESWVFFSREVGSGIVRVSLGATKRQRQSASESFGARHDADMRLTPKSYRSSQVVLMVRAEIMKRRWSFN